MSSEGLTALEESVPNPKGSSMSREEGEGRVVVKEGEEDDMVYGSRWWRQRSKVVLNWVRVREG